MKSFAVSSVLAAITFASKKHFPRDDAFHADCHVSAEFDLMSCDSLYALMDNEIRSWDTSAKSPSGGLYAVKE